MLVWGVGVGAKGPVGLANHSEPLPAAHPGGPSPDPRGGWIGIPGSCRYPDECIPGLWPPFQGKPWGSPVLTLIPRVYFPLLGGHHKMPSPDSSGAKPRCSLQTAHCAASCSVHPSLATHVTVGSRLGPGSALRARPLGPPETTSQLSPLLESRSFRDTAAGRILTCLVPGGGSGSLLASLRRDFPDSRCPGPPPALGPSRLEQGFSPLSWASHHPRPPIQPLGSVPLAPACSCACPGPWLPLPPLCHPASVPSSSFLHLPLSLCVEVASCVLPPPRPSPTPGSTLAHSPLVLTGFKEVISEQLNFLCKKIPKPSSSQPPRALAITVVLTFALQESEMSPKDPSTCVA